MTIVPAWRRGDGGEHGVDLDVFDVGDGHQVGGRLVAQLVAVLDHLDRFGDLMGIEGDADHVEHAFAARARSAASNRFCRRRRPSQLSLSPVLVGVVAGEHAVEVGLVAAHPGSVRLLGKLLGRVLVADFHVVDAGGDACVVDRADQLVGELMVVHQSAVADRAIEDFRARGGT